MSFELEKEYNKVLEERNIARHEVEILKKKINDLENKKCSDLKKYISILEKRLENCNENSEADCSEYKKEIERLKDEVKALNENDERYENIFNQQKANIEKWKKKYEKAKKELDEFSDTVQALESGNKRLIAENETLKLEIEGLKLEIKNIKEGRDTDGCEAKYKALRSSFNILSNEYDGLMKSHKKLKEQIAEQENWKAKYYQLEREKLDIIEQYEKKIKELSNNSQTKMARANTIELMEMIIDGKKDEALKMLLNYLKVADNLFQE